MQEVLDDGGVHKVSEGHDGGVVVGVQGPSQRMAGILRCPPPEILLHPRHQQRPGPHVARAHPGRIHLHTVGNWSSPSTMEAKPLESSAAQSPRYTCTLQLRCLSAEGGAYLDLLPSIHSTRCHLNCKFICAEDAIHRISAHKFSEAHVNLA